MEFIKHNLGFFLYTVVTVLLLGGMGVIWGAASKKEKDFADKVKRQQAFMAQVQSKEYSLTQPNLEIAKQNQIIAKQQYQNFLLTLATRYGIRIETINGLDCVRKVKDDCVKMQEDLTAKGIYIDASAGFFSFDGIARSTVIPSPDEVTLILKNLWVVNETVRLVGKSGVTGFSSVRRPGGLEFVDKGTYAMLPLELTVSGGFKSIQRLINLLHTEAYGIFILQSIELEVEDQAAGGRIAALGSLGGQGAAGMGGEMGGGMSPMMPGMAGGMLPMMVPGMGGGMPAGGMLPKMTAGTGADATRAGGGRASSTRGKPAEDKDKVTLLELDREQRGVFSQQEVMAKIILGFVEFKKPAQEK